MTMTLADSSVDDGGMGPRADRPKRRTFTAEYKANILAEYEAADRGERGAILRREGLYSSHIVEWRKAADAGARSGLAPATKDRRDREIEQLRARAEKAEAELTKTRAALDLVGKAHALLETLSESAEPPRRSPRRSTSWSTSSRRTPTSRPPASCWVARVAVTTGPRRPSRQRRQGLGRRHRTRSPTPNASRFLAC